MLTDLPGYVSQSLVESPIRSVQLYVPTKDVFRRCLNISVCRISQSFSLVQLAPCDEQTERERLLRVKMRVISCLQRHMRNVCIKSTNNDCHDGTAQRAGLSSLNHSLIETEKHTHTQRERERLLEVV